MQCNVLPIHSVPLSAMAIFIWVIKFLSLEASRENHSVTETGYFAFYNSRNQCVNTDTQYSYQCSPPFTKWTQPLYSDR